MQSYFTSFLYIIKEVLHTFLFIFIVLRFYFILLFFLFRCKVFCFPLSCLAAKNSSLLPVFVSPCLATFSNARNKISSPHRRTGEERRAWAGRAGRRGAAWVSGHPLAGFVSSARRQREAAAGRAAHTCLPPTTKIATPSTPDTDPR